MIFLKKFIASGFKSFATPIEINFSSNMAGIIGPNGSGKSNIVDAIKWVLGEKSNKNLRGKNATDVIFHGSKDHAEAKSAEVTLVFDNSKKQLHYESEEVSITRKITRGESSQEYFVNNQPARLKDIQDIFLDTGLSKGSLGIVSQGTVQWFVETSPEDRRTIFEEAAGIGLYSKKKAETNSQLEKTEENLRSITGIVDELNADVKKLSKQVEKAKIYTEIKNQLTKLELTILVKDVKFYKDKLAVIDKELSHSKSELEIFEPEVKQIYNSLQLAKENVSSSDGVIEKNSIELSNVVDEINNLELKKQSITSSLKLDINSENIEKKISAYKQLISSCNFEINDAKSRADKIEGEIETYASVLTQLSQKKDTISKTISDLNLKLSEIRFELRRIQETFSSNNSLDAGPRTIVENQHSLAGVLGLVKDFLVVDEKYDKAISIALGKATQYVIVREEDDATECIQFLKNNKAGKATFLPIDTIKGREIRHEHLQLIQSLPGFINTAEKLVNSSKNESANIFSFLLGNIIICDNLANATQISKYISHSYRVITLDGDTINIGGSMTGGYNKANYSMSPAALEKKFKTLDDESKSIENSLNESRKELESTTNEFNESAGKQNERKLLLNKYREREIFNQKQLSIYEIDYNSFSSSAGVETKTDYDESSLNEKISKLNSKKDKLNLEINVARQTKAVSNSKVSDLDAKLTESRFQIDKYRDSVSTNENNKIKCESVLENAKSRIIDNYRMTLEHAAEVYVDELPMSENQARETIAKLRYELDKIGNINMEAASELEEKSARFNELTQQKDQLEKARNEIASIIKELDEKAKKDFSNAITKTNEELPKIFKYLFGGGECKVEYTDPDNIITSGIDVIATPPGKTSVYLNLLSGGEKTLVALSILFAILANKTFPLIILDEAEAALDPANVERFGSIVQKYSNNTQFLVITHRPGTMERCDTLYGTTMQTKGVTDVYPVSLVKAKKIVEQSETSKSAA